MDDFRDYRDFTNPLPHPGEHLREDFLPQYGFTAGRLAKAMGLKDRQRLERIIRGTQAVTADTALRLARVFGTSPQFWMNLQASHDLSKAAIAAREELEKIQRARALPLEAEEDDEIVRELEDAKA
jgi:addiction module HigA family antidote